jgi:hypothetical protein
MPQVGELLLRPQLQKSLPIPQAWRESADTARLESIHKVWSASTRMSGKTLAQWSPPEVDYNQGFSEENISLVVVFMGNLVINLQDPYEAYY